MFLRIFPGFLYGLLAFFNVVGFDNLYIFNSTASAGSFYLHYPSLFSLAELGSYSGMGLTSRHGGYAVVENSQNKGVFIVDGTCQAGQSHVEEGGITYGGHYGTVFTCHFMGKVESGCHGHRSSHVHYGVHSLLVHSKGVTAYIRGVYRLGKSLADGEETGPVGTAGAEHGLAGRYGQVLKGCLEIRIRSHCCCFLSQTFKDYLLDYFWKKFPCFRDISVPSSLDLCPVGDLHFNYGICFLYDNHVFMSFYELIHHSEGQWMGGAYLEDGDVFPAPGFENVHYYREGYSGRDDTKFCLSLRGNFVVILTVAALKVFPYGFKLCVQPRMVHPHPCG